MVVCVGIGTFTGAVFLIVLLFVAGNMDEVVNSSAGPLLEILIHATNNRVGGICLLMYDTLPLSHATNTNVGLQAPSRLPIIRNTQRHDNKQPNDLCIRQARRPSFLAPSFPEAHGHED